MSSYHLFNSIEREENYELMGDTFTSIAMVVADLDEMKNIIFNVSDEIKMKDWDEIKLKLDFLNKSINVAKDNIKKCENIILERANCNQQSYDEANSVGIKQYLMDNM